MTRIRRSLIGVATLIASVGLTLVPAEAAHARPIDDCWANLTPDFTSPTIAAGGNNLTLFASPLQLQNNDAIQITATGSITIDYWGTSKSVAGDAETAPFGWPKQGAPRYMLLGQVDEGWVTISGTTYNAGQWFPIGFDSFCLRYHRATPITSTNPSALLTLGYNDSNISDNGGRGNVVVRQWR